MTLVLIPLMVLPWSPARESTDVISGRLRVECTAPQRSGDDAVTRRKRKCNSQCEGANDKSQCVAEGRRACER
jgi:hypothetical protein